MRVQHAHLHGRVRRRPCRLRPRPPSGRAAAEDEDETLQPPTSQKTNHSHYTLACNICNTKKSVRITTLCTTKGWGRIYCRHCYRKRKATLWLCDCEVPWHRCAQHGRITEHTTTTTSSTLPSAADIANPASGKSSRLSFFLRRSGIPLEGGPTPHTKIRRTTTDPPQLTPLLLQLTSNATPSHLPLPPQGEGDQLHFQSNQG